MLIIFELFVGYSSKSIEEEQHSNPPHESLDFPAGSRLRVKYGKGKNIKVYDAKVVEAQCDTGSVPQYKVHYAGWNIRYDEWVKKDRIVHCLDKGHIPKTLPAVAVKMKVI